MVCPSLHLLWSARAPHVHVGHDGHDGVCVRASSLPQAGAPSVSADVQLGKWLREWGTVGSWVLRKHGVGLGVGWGGSALLVACAYRRAPPPPFPNMCAGIAACLPEGPACPKTTDVFLASAKLPANGQPKRVQTPDACRHYKSTHACIVHCPVPSPFFRPMRIASVSLRASGQPIRVHLHNRTSRKESSSTTNSAGIAWTPTLPTLCKDTTRFNCS